MDQQPPGEGRQDQENRGETPADDGILGEIQPQEPEQQPEDERARPSSRRRRRSRTIGCLLALLGALAGGLLAMWIWREDVVGRLPADEAEVEATAEEATEVPANRLVFSPTPERPDETPEIISAETEVIYGFYDLGRLPGDAPLSGTWSHEGRSLGDLPLMDLQRDDDAEHARGRFEIAAPKPESAEAPSQSPTVGFPPGIYEVELSSPDYPDVTATASFVALPRAAQILQGGGEPEGPPVIRSLQTATGVTDDGEPIGPSTSFPPDIKRITAVFSYQGIAPGSVLTVRWHAGDQELTRARTEIPVTAAKGRGEAWLEAEQALPPGSYRVSVHLGDDDQGLASTGFSVAQSGTAPSPTP